MKNIMKINAKILLILVFFVMLFYTFNNSFVYARDPDALINKDEEVTGDKQEEQDESELSGEFNPDYWNPTTSTTEGDAKLLSLGNKIIGPVQLIGNLISVATIIIIGIKYMLGSVEEKAQYKETLGPYFLGAVLVFGIINVVSVIHNIAISLF